RDHRVEERVDLLWHGADLKELRVELAQRSHPPQLGVRLRNVVLSLHVRLVIDGEDELDVAERNFVVVENFGPAFLFSVDPNGPFAIEFTEAEVPPIEDDLRVKVRESRRRDRDIGRARTADGDDLFIDGKVTRAPFRRYPDEGRHSRTIAEGSTEHETYSLGTIFKPRPIPLKCNTARNR